MNWLNTAYFAYGDNGVAGSLTIRTGDQKRYWVLPVCIGKCFEKSVVSTTRCARRFVQSVLLGECSSRIVALTDHSEGREQRQARGYWTSDTICCTPRSRRDGTAIEGAAGSTTLGQALHTNSLARGKRTLIALTCRHM